MRQGRSEIYLTEPMVHQITLAVLVVIIAVVWVIGWVVLMLYMTV